jgi:hypothetical protein
MGVKVYQQELFIQPSHQPSWFSTGQAHDSKPKPA